MSETGLVHVPVEYCEICGVPKSYCKFFNLHPVEKPQEGESAPQDEAKEEVSAPKPVAKGSNKPEAVKPKIQIVIKARTKRKMLTHVTEFEKWGIDGKELSKAISKQMATSTTSKMGQTGMKIIVQGDGSQNISSILKKNFKVPQNMIVITRKIKKQEEGEENTQQ